jgi:flagellar motor protein MotB
MHGCTEFDQLAPRRAIRPWIGALALAVLGGSGCNLVPRGQYERSRDYAMDLQRRLTEANQQIARLEEDQQRVEYDREQLAQQLGGQQEIQSILRERIDNLKRENDRMQHDLTGVVLNAGGSKAFSNSVITTVSGASAARFDLPGELTKSLTDLSRKQKDVAFDPAKRLIRIPNDVLFVDGGDQLRRDAQGILRQVSTQLSSQKASSLNLLIVGHAAPGTTIPRELLAQHPTDWHLAAHQAIAVQQYMEECGVSAARVGIISYGSHQPLVDGADEVAKRKNERLEIYLLPPELSLE